METIRDRLPTVIPPRALIEQLKHEVYSVGTSMRQVAYESALSVDTVKSLLQGNNAEQATVARVEAYLRALSRNEFYASRSRLHKKKGSLSKIDARFYAYNRELWKVYKVSTKRLEQFQAFDRRHKLVWLNHEDYICKKLLIEAYKPHIDRFRIWLLDGWSYFRCKRFLIDKLATLGVKT